MQWLDRLLHLFCFIPSKDQKMSIYRVSNYLSKNRFAAAGRKLLAGNCLGCHCRLQTAAVICQSCLAKMTESLQDKQFCLTCGQTLTGESKLTHCKACIEEPSAIEMMGFLVHYKSLVADLLVAAKLGGSVTALTGLQQLLQHYLESEAKKYRHSGNENSGESEDASQNIGGRLSSFARYWQSGYTLLPMPTPKLRLMQRGFNLPSIFAKQLSQHFQLPILPSDVVKLPLKTQKQGLLSRQQRLKNHRIYQINHKIPEKIVLIDDIYTTGQTVKDLAKQLRQNGAKSVAVWVFSRGEMD